MEIDGVEQGPQNKNPSKEGGETKHKLIEKDDSDEIPKDLNQLIKRP